MSLGINTRITNTREQPTTLGRGKTLYVGGTGEGNYSKIQDAIDNASDEDTVFVYDDSSPYYENVVVNKSINLIGEDKDITIIDGGGSESTVVYVSADWVNISGFTIRNGISGIRIYCSEYNTITGNIISNNIFDGISLYDSNSNTIIGNTISSNNNDGIILHGSSSNTITGNTISSNNNYGIILSGSNSNTISGNTISSNHDYGIYLYLSSNRNTISLNTISDNGLVGIELRASFFYGRYPCNFNTVIKNNFLDNERDAYFEHSFFNQWKQNYWNGPRTFPKLILGEFKFLGRSFKWFNIDWNPAKEPYDIEGGI